MSDIVERLRSLNIDFSCRQHLYSAISDSATEIEHLTADNEMLLAALGQAVSELSELRLDSQAAWEAGCRALRAHQQQAMNSEDGEMIYVIAHDGGCEGYGGPIQAFKTKQEAVAAASLGESLKVFEVPEWPEPAGPSFYLRILSGHLDSR